MSQAEDIFYVIEQNLPQLNNYTKLFLKQQAEGIDKFVEIEAMKHASENNKREYFKMMVEGAIIMQCNHCLESKLMEQKLMKRLDSLKNNNTNNTKDINNTKIDDDSEKDDENKGEA